MDFICAFDWNAALGSNCIIMSIMTNFAEICVNVYPMLDILAEIAVRSQKLKKKKIIFDFEFKISLCHITLFFSYCINKVIINNTLT